MKRAYLGSGRALVLAYFLSCSAAGAGNEGDWLPILKQVLHSEKRCDFGTLLWVREVPIANFISLEGRVRCLDGREFDFLRRRPHMKFEVQLCQPTVC